MKKQQSLCSSQYSASGPVSLFAFTIRNRGSTELALMRGWPQRTRHSPILWKFILILFVNFISDLLFLPKFNEISLLKYDFYFVCRTNQSLQILYSQTWSCRNTFAWVKKRTLQNLISVIYNGQHDPTIDSITERHNVKNRCSPISSSGTCCIIDDSCQWPTCPGSILFKLS